MLTPEIIRRVRRLLNREGFSQRRVAAMLGVSRGSVHAIAQGFRTEEPPAPRGFHRPEGPVVRCPVCGSRTQLPCTFCAALAQVEKYGVSPDWFTAEHRENEIDLRGEERERYLAIRRWREQQRNPHYHELPEEWPFRGSE